MNRSIKFKDIWINDGEKTVEISTETVYANSETELNNKTKKMINSRIGENVFDDGTLHICELYVELTKEEMFDFILENDVIISENYISINGIVFDKDLVKAITEYIRRRYE